MRMLTLFSLLAASFVHSQPLWLPQNSNIPPSEMVNVFSEVDDQVCWASTMDTSNTVPSGYIRTVDGGNTWVYARIPGTGEGIIGQMDPLDADTAYAAVWVWQPWFSGGGIYKTTDAGSTWTKQNAYGPSTSGYGAGVIHFFDANNGVVIGVLHPETYTTTDGGEHWNLASMPPSYSGEAEWSDLVSAGNCAWFTTNLRVFRSTDRGHTWSASVPEPQYSNWFPSIAFQDSNTGIYSQKLEGQLPHRYRKTTNGGATWTLLSNPILDSIAPTGIRYIPGTRATYLIAGGMNMGMRGLALTADAGDHWSLLDSSGACFLGFASDSVGWCSPHQHTNAVHRYIGPPLPRDWPVFAITPPGLSFSQTTVGDSLEETVTVKNPSTATLTISAITSNNPIDFGFTPASGVLAGGESLIVRVVFHPADTGLKAANIAFLHDAPGSPDTVNLTGIGVDTALSVTIEQSWNLISVPLLASDFQRTAIFPSSISQASAYQPGIGYVATDTLANGVGYWLKFPASGSVPMIGVPLNIDSAVVLTGWNLIGSISSPVPVASIGSVPGGIVTSPFYTYGTMGYEQATTITPGKGYWVKVTQPGSLVLSSVPPPMEKIRIVVTGEMPPAPPGEVTAESNVEKPREFTLGQNFPNPFNPSATIRYSLPHNSFVTLTVYNTLGQQVAQLVNEQQQAGYHDVVFRGDGLASGVYFYRLDAGSFTSVMKLLLLK